MRKALTHTIFISTALIVVAMFVTATSYEQLGVSIILYPFVAIYAYLLFVRDRRERTPQITSLPVASVPKPEEEPQDMDTDKKSIEVVDIDKRAFLKIIGATGISYLLFSLLGRRIDSSIFQSQQNPFSDQPTAAPRTDENVLENYRISEIGYDNLITYYGFIRQDGAWIIMKEDSSNSSFRYASGASDFGKNWNIRENLEYVYYSDLKNE